jgi:hypothetical protein
MAAHHTIYLNNFDQALQDVAYVARDPCFERKDGNRKNQNCHYLGTVEGRFPFGSLAHFSVP